MLLRTLDRLWFWPPASAFRRAAAGATDLLAPSWCIGCRAAATDLCLSCSADLRLLTREPFRAEEPAESLPILPDLSVLPVFSAGQYTTLVADAVLAFKDHERIRLARVLAPALGRAVTAACQASSSAALMLVWPPPRLRARLYRGRHPLGELIDGIELDARASLGGHLLRHREGLRDLPGLGSGQKARSKQARRRTGASFTLQPGAAERLDGSQVVLVDDVLTTGATLRELFRVLTNAGAEVQAAAVLAATPR